MRQLIAKLGPYGLSTIVTFATGILSVPFIIAVAGSSQWTGLAITQSVAALAAVIVGFGWPATGPSMIGGMPVVDRPGAYWRSLQVRTLLLVATAPFAVWVSIAITSLEPAAAALGTIAYLLQALGGMWYFVGEARPYRVLMFDTLPRTFGILVALGALWLTKSMTVYTAILLVGTLTAGVLTAIVVLRGSRLSWLRGAGIMNELYNQRHGTVASASGAVYANSPLIIASILIPGPIDAFTLAFKLYNYAAAAFQPLVQIAQGWVPAGGPGDVIPRIRSVRQMAYIGAAVLLLGMTALLPFFADVLSGGSIAVGFDLSIPFGLCLAAVFLNQITGLACLTALGRTDVLATSAALGAVIGIALLCGLAIAAGEVGLAWALCITEWVVTVVQLLALSRAIRLRPHPDHEPKLSTP